MPAGDEQLPKSRTSGEAFLLAGVGGCIDAVGVLTLGGLFVSHMSGNSAMLGATVGQGNWQAGLPHLFAIPVFVIGLFLGYAVLIGRPNRRYCAWVLLVEAGLLAFFALRMTVFGDPPAAHTMTYFSLVALPLLAMGLQNATLRQVGLSAFPSTYVTGVLDTFGRVSAQIFVRSLRRLGGQKADDSSGPQDMTTACRAAGIWFAYLTGALCGSAGLLVIHHVILVLPITILVILAVRYLLLSAR